MNMIVASAAMTASAQPALAEKTPEVVPRGPKGEKRPAVTRLDSPQTGPGTAAHLGPRRDHCHFVLQPVSDTGRNRPP
jgi:hypothetical protein